MLLNTTTPRIFIAATRQNDGKTTNSLGLLAALQARFGNVGYIKPVGQRFVEIDAEKIDEDSVLMDRVFRLNCPLVDMSPIAVEPDFTRKYLQAANYETLVKRIHKAFDRVAWEKEFVLCEGTGHAGVGSVFDLSNATVARLLNAKVVIVTRGGIGLPIDEVTLNCALFEREGVEVIGVILNKVLPEKLDYITEFAEKGLRRKGLQLLGVVPHQPLLSYPTLEVVRDELGARELNESGQLQNIIEHVVIGAMGPARASALFQPGVLLIVPADRDDIIRCAGEYLKGGGGLAGIALSDDIAPSAAVLKLTRGFRCPVLLTPVDSYAVASRVHDLIVKIRPGDTEKIRIVRDLIARHVRLDKILDAIGPLPETPVPVKTSPAP